MEGLADTENNDTTLQVLFRDVLDIESMIDFIKFHDSSLLNVKLKVMKYKIYELLTLK